MVAVVFKPTGAFYTYWKWNITGARGPTTMIQAAEFTFQKNGVSDAMTGVTVSNPGGSNPGGEEPSKLSDGNTNTKWLDFNFSGNNSTPSSGNSTFIWQFNTAKSFDGYTWYTANDADNRDPITWTISASKDGTTYTTLDTRTNVSITTNRYFLAGTFTF
jgi:hypothetical protein